MNLVKIVPLSNVSRGTTNTADALRMARTSIFSQGVGDRPNAVNLAIVITDGSSNQPEETVKEARLARGRGVHLISVGIGNWLDKYELRSIASYPTELNLISVENFNSISTIRGTIKDAVCNSKFK